MDFAVKLKTWREKSCLTQADLAARSGVSKIYISEIERGHKVPGIDIVEKLSKGLGMSMTTLISPKGDTCIKILDLIRKTNLTCKEFARDVLGVPVADIEGIDDGKLPPYSTLKKIAKHFNIPVDELAGDEYSEEKQLLDFLINQSNFEYIRLAFEIKSKGINPDAVRSLIDAHLNLKKIQK